MFKKKKSYDELRAILFDPTTKSTEREEVILFLLNDLNNEAVFPIFKDYILFDDESTPIQPIFNYKGEYLSGIKTLVINKLGRIEKTEIKNLLLYALGKYYIFKQMREAIFDVLSNDFFKSKDIAVNLILSQASQDHIPIKIYKELIIQYSNYLPDKVNYLYNILLSPESVSSDFPSVFNKDIYDIFVSIKGKKEALFSLIQSMAEKCSRPNVNYFQKDYLEPFHEALQVLKDNINVFITEIHKKKETITFLNRILQSVSQSEDEWFLLSFKESKITADRFIYFWRVQIITRAKLRKQLLSYLIVLGDDNAKNESSIIEKSKNSSLDEIKAIYREIDGITNLSDHSNIAEFIGKLEILLEIIEWSFIEILDSKETTKFDIIKAILLRVNALIRQQSTAILNSDTNIGTILNLLQTTTEEAINQFLFRQSVFQKIVKSEEFLLKLQQREVKYLKLELEPIHSLTVKFNNIKDLADKQKKRFNHLIANFNENLVMEFLSKLNDVIARITNLPNYYVMFKTNLKVYNAKYAKKDSNKYFLDDIKERLSIFYRNFDAMLSVTLQQELSVVSFRRIDTIIDLINDFLSYNGLIDFDTEYFAVQ